MPQQPVSGPGCAASIDEIKQFLREVRKEVSTPGRFIFVPRSGNMNCIANLGLSIENVKSEIICLTYKDYDRGPLPDDSRPGDIWEFIKDIDGTMVYIKLKLDKSRGCVCLSFHESTGPCTLPYR